MIKALFLMSLVLILLSGCVALQETLGEIKDNPKSFMLEAQNEAQKTRTAFPELPFILSIGIGYGTAFLRRLYQNAQRAKAKTRTAT